MKTSKTIVKEWRISWIDFRGIVNNEQIKFVLRAVRVTCRIPDAVRRGGETFSIKPAFPKRCAAWEEGPKCFSVESC